jgi:hypothetical protein
MEYIIQLDPPTLETLRAGQAVQSDIPPTAGDIRSYRIVVGKQQLPRETPPEPKHEELAPPMLSPPGTLPPVTDGKRIAERAASYVDGENSAVAKTATDGVTGPERPWLPLWMTVLGLFTSIGVNVFLGWIAWESRRQMRLGLKGVIR